MSGYNFDRLKVMVVDDNLHMRKVATTILRAFGVIQIYEAADGLSAWKMLPECDPDIVLLDWMMDGMSGFEFTKMVRTSADSPNQYLPIIMLTGNSSIECVNAARDAGINEFLTKPVSVKAVMVRLTSVIEHPRAFIRTESYFGPCRRRHRSEDYRGPERRSDSVIDIAAENLRAAS
jgi:two-component system chemotaxis response regulator CheY